MDDQLKRLMLLALFLIVPSLTLAQSATELEPYTPFSGAIPSPGATQTWTFRGLEGGVVSLLARGESNDFDPVITVTNSSGATVIANDDFAYPGSRDALLQAITLPRTDTYTVTISGYGESTGTYALTLFYGYPDLQAFLNFNSEGESWDISSDDLTLDDSAGTLGLFTEGIDLGGYVVDTNSREFGDFYARVLVESIEAANGWNIGLTLRHQDDGYYILLFNQRGQWRFVAQEGDSQRVIRDWTNHPAIVAGETQFTIGVLAHGAGFDVFYNEAFVGQAVDSANAFPEAGQIGFYARTNNILNSRLNVQYDDFTLTIPMKLGENEIIPSQLISGVQGITIQELERRRVIPAGGYVGLSVTESSGRQIEPGVNRVIFSRGTQFEDMVLSTFFTLGAARDGIVGCGVIFNHTTETSYALAFLDQVGGHGLSERSGDSFAPGLFNVNLAWAAEDRHHLLVVRFNGNVDFYVNRQHIGRMPMSAGFGEVGVAVVNYENMDTSCQFSDTWVWRLD